MSLAQIEAELEPLSPDGLRRLALQSWSAFVKKEGDPGHECREQDPALLAALDVATAAADAAPLMPSTSCRATAPCVSSTRWIQGPLPIRMSPDKIALL